jgi:hypothetical protein
VQGLENLLHTVLTEQPGDEKVVKWDRVDGGFVVAFGVCVLLSDRKVELAHRASSNEQHVERNTELQVYRWNRAMHSPLNPTPNGGHQMSLITLVQKNTSTAT